MRLPQVSLAMMLYVVTAICIFMAVGRVTAHTPYDDPVGGLVLWLLIFGGIGLFFWRRSRRRSSSRATLNDQ